MQADWQARNTSVQDYTVVHSEFDDDFFQTLVVAHTVDGLIHYGLIRVPPYPAMKSFGVLNSDRLDAVLQETPDAQWE